MTNQRANWDMRSVTQNDPYGCGPACLAMLCNIELDVAFQTCKDSGWKSGYGIEESELKEAFRRHGYVLGEGIELRKLFEKKTLNEFGTDCLLWGPIIEDAHACWPDDTAKADLKFTASELVEGAGKGEDVQIHVRTFDHWAVWDGKQNALRDPFGIKAMFFPSYYYLVNPT